MTLERLFSGWRLGHPRGLGADGEPFEDLTPAHGLTLFETIEQSDVGDERTYVLWRGDSVFALMNVYPYSSGHTLVVPKKGYGSMDELPQTVHEELWDTVRKASRAVKSAFNPHGLNIGLNEGTAGGASQPDHLHVHVVPRWAADTNFMTSIAEARILPVSLTATWEQLRANWPPD
jgi:ATP adenylyltransferase